ncbi:MAG TPA: hypothetical protein VJN50_01105 [Actinomycetota bacterium]|nr:hypothetical protein [Actinomycetota bacterium]
MTKLHEDERGLLMKAVAITLVFLVVFGIAAIDTGSILVAKYNLTQLAEQAAFEGALAYRTGHDKSNACARAENVVAEQDSDATHPRIGWCVVDSDGVVTITLKKTANTFVAKRISYFEEFTHLRATEQSGAPK